MPKGIQGFQKGNRLGECNKGENHPYWKGGISSLPEVKKQYHKNYRENNPDVFKKSQKKYKESAHGQKRRREWYLKKFFDITPEQYDEMLRKQNNCCAICGVHQSKMKKILEIDHCHNSGKIRGLLCNPCNQALGLLGDSIDSVKKVLEYLQKDDNGIV